MLNLLVTDQCGPKYRKELEENFGGLCSIEFLPINESPEKIKKADIIIGEPRPEYLAAARNLKWVQMTYAGADMYTKDATFPENVMLTNVSGAFGAIISEYVIGAILEDYRLFNIYRKNAERHLWNDSGTEQTLEGKTVLILGTGDIGSNLAKRLRAFGVKTVGIRRNAAVKPEYFDEVYGVAQLDRLLGAADITVCCLPRTDNTEDLFSVERLRLLKEGSLFINVGRGSAVNTDGLIMYLNEGHKTHFVLDVLTQEPLSKDSPLWDNENVFITPHISGKGLGHAPETERKVWDICIDNLRRFLKSQSLCHAVDIKKGY